MYRKNDPVSLTKKFTKYHQRDGRLKRVLSTAGSLLVWGFEEEKTYWSNLRIPLHKILVSYDLTWRI